MLNKSGMQIKIWIKVVGWLVSRCIYLNERKVRRLREKVGVTSSTKTWIQTNKKPARHATTTRKGGAIFNLPGSDIAFLIDDDE